MQALALLCGGPPGLEAQGTRFLRDPDVGPNDIVFVHANDIWLVGRDGGDAIRLTSGEGAETDPVFSPDGQWIAFTGEYAGNVDVFLIPAHGGEPKRLTWHPGEDVVQGWTPNGDILFRSGRDGQPTRLWRFYTVGVAGGFPRPLAVPQAYQGEMSADGAWLAYQEIGYWDPEWRNYRGGQAQPVSVVATGNWDRVTPPWEGERQMAPVWMDGVVYYMSERDWASNVWSWNPQTGEERQRTFHDDFDVKSLGAGYGVVVYEQGGYLHELNPITGTTRQLEIRVARDLNWARPRWEEVPAGGLRDARLSPTGKRALFEYRGDLFTVPAENGSWRNLTRSPGVADRHAVWSPDGDRIAWFNDAGGEYGLIVADQDGGNARRIDIPDPTFYFVPTWSPDGTLLAFTDTDYRVLIVDLASGNLTHVDTDRYAHPQRTMNPVWSPDSRWIAYARRLDNQLRAVFVHDTRTGETRQLTDGMADAISPVWDASGKYLYFLASTDYGLNTGWLDMTSYDRPVTRALYVALLREGEASPFLPKSDEEVQQGEDEEAEEQPRGGRSAGGSQSDSVEVPEVTIDFEGIARRIVDAPNLPLRDYVDLVEGPEGRVFVAEAAPNQRGFTLQRYTLDDKEAEKFLENVQAGTVSHDRKKLLYRSGDNWSIVN
ncbi:MAG: protease, partial [Gemmatimonas sp. SG8_17]